MISAAVCGASGYGGQELVKILLKHPNVRLTAVTSEQNAGQDLSSVIESLRGQTDLKFEKLDTAALLRKAEVFFLALPNEQSLAAAPPLLAEGRRVVDLSGAYRLKNALLYPEWYKFEHSFSDELKIAVPGVPELYHDEIASARLLANAGCYATAVILALAPLMKLPNAKDFTIAVDGKSGLSGSGRKASLELSFCEAENDVRPYRITKHQHVPEIEQALRYLNPDIKNIAFTPSVVPMVKGISICAYIYGSRAEDPEYAKTLRDMYKQFYSNAPFVRTLDGDAIPHTKAVMNTNFCDVNVFYNVHAKCIVAVSAIDNLIKGAAGSAVQNFNIMHGIDERAGLV